MVEPDRQLLTPALFGAMNDRFRAFFARYARRMLAKDFHRVNLTPASRVASAAFNAHAGPAILVMNHASWWDPLVALVVGSELFPSRKAIAPMHSEQLKRFAFMRRLGMFGIDPDNPASLSAMSAYVASFFQSHPAPARPTLILTPQGTFTDPREPIRVRPGAAAISAETPGVLVASLSIEYGFWQSRRPELFLRFETLAAPNGSRADDAGEQGRASTTSWHRVITSGMQANADALATLVKARDPAPFESLFRTRGSSINPAYDLWLRLRGKSGEIELRRESAHAARAESTNAARGEAHA